jgi:two-component sensor histidine kinase/PAS domain-containing protein
MNAFTLLLYLNAGVTLFLAFAVLQRRNVPGSTHIFFLMIAAALWSLSYALELGSLTQAMQLLWKKIKYIGIVFIPVSSFFLSLCYRSQKRNTQRRHIVILSIIPILILASLWTNEYHHLFYRTTGLLKFPPEYGPAFWLHAIYSYILLCFTIINLIRSYRSLPGVFKTQTSIILISFALPWLLNILYISRILAFLPIDPTPLAFSLIGIALSTILFSLNIFQPIPVAENHIVNNLKDVVLILTPQNQIIKINSAAENIIGSKTEKLLGLPLKSVEENIFKAIVSNKISDPGGCEIAIKKEKDVYYYQCQLSPLLNRKGKLIAKVVLLSDISRIKQIELELKKLNEDLETRIKDRTLELAKANESLQQQVSQKELLFAELHHRVKNNLNIIRSLISLQTNKIKDQNTIQELEDLKNRIISIGLIYEKLYSKDEISQLDLKKYLQELLSELGSSLSHARSNFDISNDLVKINVAVDTIIPIGLIITELITNSAKFAFNKNDNNNTINVTVLQEQERLIIKLKDNGRGYPDDILKNKVNSLGISLIQLLVKQLNGTITFSNDKGACTELAIPFTDQHLQ